MQNSQCFDRICRTCMLQSPSLISLFDGDSRSTESTKMLASLTSVKAKPMDGLPQHICLSCLADINQVITFKMKCERSDQTLRSLLKAVQPKIEPTMQFVIKEDRNEYPKTTYYLDTMDEDIIIEALDETDSKIGLKIIEQSIGSSNDKADEDVTVFIIDKNTFKKEDQDFDQDMLPSSLLEVTVEQEKSGKRVKYKCEKCEKIFLNKLIFLNHEQAKNCSLRSFQCYICKSILSSKTNLGKHLKSHSEEIHKCPDCVKKFKRIDQLSRHKRNHHPPLSDGKPFTCSICEKPFKFMSSLNIHLKRHANIREFSCDECGIAFVTRQELDSHKRAHTGLQLFVCDTCGISCTTSSGLVKHKRVHTGERPYACEFCPMKFRVLTTLKNHRRKHTGQKPYECEICQRSFTQRSDCVKHQRSHTDERYHCPICKREFVTESTANAHFKRAHKINHEAIRLDDL